MDNKKELTILELFSGIGAATAALKRLNFNVKVADSVEFDKLANKAFNILHDTNFKAKDIKDYHYEGPELDLVIFGSPCQDFSKMGKQEGGKKGSGTRSSLVFEAIRVIEEMENKPKVVIWENVASVFEQKSIGQFMISD